MSENGSSTRRRVKLYMLNEDRQWDDKGTGYVSSVLVESLGGIALLVVSEADGSSLLESKIQPDTAYQKQQETLIVWSEAESIDLALSFQEKEGCEEIWGKICSVQGKDPSVEITQEVVDETEAEECDENESEGSLTCGLAAAEAAAFELPPCELSRLEEVAELVSKPGMAKRGLPSALHRNGYLRRLCTDLFHAAEDLEDRESLKHLNEIVRGVFLMNHKFLLDVLLDPEVIMDVIGILEYEPGKPAKAAHREFLKSQTRFREPLQFQNPSVREKIHQTYRMQYIQECILPTPSLFDDNQFPELATMILINKMNVLNAVADDDKLMLSLFTSLRDPQNSNERRLELTLFLKELCSFSTTLETTFWKPQTNVFYNSLTDHQALDAMVSLYATNCPQIRTAVTDILLAFIDNSPGLVREHMMKDAGPDSRLLINVVIGQMCSDSDPEMGDALRLAGVLRVLVDPESMVGAQPSAGLCSYNAIEFLRFFYQRAMPNLLEPLFVATSGQRPARDDYCTAQLLYFIVDLLTFCAEQHTQHVKNLVQAKDVIRRVLVLLQSKHSFLVLGALRLLRRIVSLKDEFYDRHLIKNGLFQPVVDLFVRNGNRYNLINSAIIELFEFIYSEGIRSLIFHLVEQHWQELKDVNYVSTFRSIHLRYEQLKDKARDARRGPSSPSVVGYGLALQSMGLYPRPIDTAYRIRRDPRQPDEEEELWFEQDEEEPPLYGQAPMPKPSALAVSSSKEATPLADCADSEEQEPATKRRRIEGPDDAKCPVNEELDDAKCPTNEELTDATCPVNERPEDAKHPRMEESEGAKCPATEEPADVKFPRMDRPEDTKCPRVEEEEAQCPTMEVSEEAQCPTMEEAEEVQCPTMEESEEAQCPKMEEAEAASDAGQMAAGLPPIESYASSACQQAD